MVIISGYAPCLACGALFGSLVSATCNSTSCAQLHESPQIMSPHDCIYIILTLLLWDLSTLCVLDHLWPLIYIYIHVSFPVKSFDMCLFQLQDLQYEILLKPNHLQELFFINIFPVEILNMKEINRNHYFINKIIKRQIKQWQFVTVKLMLPLLH